MQWDSHLVTWLGGLTIGVVVWALRLEGRVNTNERVAKQQTEALIEAAEERKKLDDERHVDNKARLARIEAKLDSLPFRLNGGSHDTH